MIRSVRRRAWGYAIAALLIVCANGQAQPQADAFAAGTAAFERGEFANALRLFQDARAAGSDGAALEYNIGVCLYRTGDYAQAEAAFDTLASRFAGFRALAQYNRGLALLALERRKDALAAFEAARVEGDERLAALAGRALAELGGSEPTKVASHWLGYFGFALGHDDNVALVDELSLPANVAASSPLTELVGYASKQFATRVPLRLDLSGYVVRYASDHAFDQDTMRVDTAFQWSAGEAWRLEAGPYFANSVLDGDAFERTLGAQVRAARSLGERLMVDLRFVYDDIASPTTRFDFVSGHRERVRVTLEHSVAERKLRAAYERESQDRADPSVSPDRSRFVLGVSQVLRGSWSIDGGVSHRTSRYGELAVARKETLVELTVAAHRKVRNDWSFDAGYRWADNDSNIPQFSYDSRRVSVGLSKTF